MNKSKIIKLIGISLLTSTLYTTNASAYSELDIIYRDTYSAVVTAMESGDQLSINNARLKIKSMPSNLDWAKGEFSKQLDIVQNKILSNIVKLIQVAQKDQTQTNVLNARKAIPHNLPSIWKNSYSSALDVVQQNIMNKARSTDLKAREEKSLVLKYEALSMYKDIMDNTHSTAIYNWAKGRYDDLKYTSFIEDSVDGDNDVNNGESNDKPVTPDVPNDSEDNVDEPTIPEDSEGDSDDSELDEPDTPSDSEDDPEEDEPITPDDSNNDSEDSDSDSEDSDSGSDNSGDIDKPVNPGDTELPDDESSVEETARLIQDDVLNNYIKKTLNITDRELTKEDLLEVYTIELQGSGVESIEGLQYCENLVYLNLGEALRGITYETNNISDITPLKDLKNLDSLYLGYNPITSLDSIKDLTNLTFLSIRNTKVTDFGVISNFTNLETLYLDGMNIGSVGYLKGLNNLKTLSISRCTIGSLSTLADLPSLDFLSITGVSLTPNIVSDLKLLKNLKRLSITMDYTQIGIYQELRNALPGCQILY